LSRFYLEGRYAEAADGGREAVKAHPEYAGLLYNLACCESLAGRTADATEHLGLAIDKSERYRSFAIGDSDSTRFARSPRSRPSSRPDSRRRRKMDRWTSGEREFTSIARYRYARQ
jgi:hypothetical protein